MNHRAGQAFVALASLLGPMSALADESAGGRAETLAAYVQRTWELPSFQLGRDVVISSTALRVSTYSTPAFIHRGQLERLGDKANELQAFCGQQGGQWHYLGAVDARKPQGKPLPADPALAGVVSKGPANEAGIRAVVGAGEQAVVDEVFKATVRAMMKRPDPLVADALEYAMQQHWLGRFECRRDASPWTATISYADAASRSDRNGYVYRDVTLKVELAESR